MNAVSRSETSAKVTVETVPRLSLGAEYLLRRAMEVCVEVVKGGEHAAENAAILKNRIESYLQLIALRHAAPDRNQVLGERELLECLRELLGCRPDESPIWDTRKWENACDRARALLKEVTP